MPIERITRTIVRCFINDPEYYVKYPSQLPRGLNAIQDIKTKDYLLLWMNIEIVKISSDKNNYIIFAEEINNSITYSCIDCKKECNVVNNM